MPIYDYECGECSHRFELRQGFGSDTVQVCPKCQSSAHRKIHSVAVIYKGSGFYTTDYARKGSSGSGDSGGSSNTGDSSPSGGSAKAGESGGSGSSGSSQ